MISNRQRTVNQRLLENLLHNLNPANSPKLSIPYTEPTTRQKKLRIVDPSQVLYLQADGQYTRIFVCDGWHGLVSKPLDYFLKDYFGTHPDFFRTHNSYLINLKYVKAVDQGRGGDVFLVDENGSSSNVPVSYLKKADFLRRLRGVEP